MPDGSDDSYDTYDTYDTYDADAVARVIARGRRRRVLVAVILLVVVPVGALASAALWFWWQLDPPGGPGDAIEVEVESGWGVTDIGDELADRGVVGSSLVFAMYARLKDVGPFQAGTYPMRRDLGVRSALEVLADGPRIHYDELAVPPGLWLEEIATRVGRLPGRSKEKFLEIANSADVRSKFQPDGVTSLEGLLWPDTYKVAESEDELDIMRTMVKEFDENADRLGLGSPDLVRTPYEVITIASLIQGEAKVDADRPLIASVIANRLRQGMALQIDATVLYASGNPQKQMITAADLEADSPYNTYVRTGLPPTPISSVTAVSLDAALAPANTDFLYYVIAGADGHHVFASTYEEHLANVEAAREKGLL